MMRAATTYARDTVDRYLATFESLEARRRHEPAWLRAARGRAMDSFVSRGFPTTQDEDWRFTNVAPIAARALAAAGHDSGASVRAAGDALVAGFTGASLVFVDGRYAASLSSGVTDDAITVADLATALRESPELLEPHLTRYASIADRPFAALNTALFDDGAVVLVKPGRVVDGAVQLVFLASGAAVSSHPRVLVVAGANSQVRLVETFAGRGSGSPHLTNAIAEIVLAEGAVVDHYRVQREDTAAFHIGLTHLHVGRSASVSSHAVALGGHIARHDAVAVLGGQGADCTLNGLYLADGTQLLDNHTEIDHAMPNGTSHELYKGIIGGWARGVFNGRIRVRPDAQKTDAKQTNKTLLLSDEAQINTKPQLEIFANDVKCTHGATVGQLSQDALFYLRARGIGADEARSLLVRAFAGEVISRAKFEPMRAELERHLAARLPGASAAEAVA